MSHLAQPVIIPATLQDYPTIQNMARFYVYDLSRDCGFISKDWAIPNDGLYENFDFINYFKEGSRKAYLVKVNEELAGFALLNKDGTSPNTNWNMGEFFIIAKFQGKGIGYQVAHGIWDMHPGKWEVSVIPENISGVNFWENTISAYTYSIFNREVKNIDYDEHQPHRIVFSFDTQSKSRLEGKNDVAVRLSKVQDIAGMVALSHQKRLAYEKAQPQFWKYAGESAEISQAKWFAELITRDDHIMLTAESNGKIAGFIIGRLTSAPEVYNPGGLTLMIDDFCVRNEADWNSVGCNLVQEIEALSRTKGAAQILVICGAHDQPKSHFLKRLGLTIASEWYVRGMG